MHARERVIRDRFAEQACSHCGARYLPSSVICLARRRAAWIVMATCGRCERRGIFVVTFPARGNAAPLIQAGEPPIAHHPTRAAPPAPTLLPRAVPDPLQPPASSTAPLPALPPAPAAPAPPSTPAPRAASRPGRSHPLRPITQADVDAMRDFLAHFDGDFSALFVRRAPQPDDDPSA